jgi:hypothetical protein
MGLVYLDIILAEAESELGRGLSMALLSQGVGRGPSAGLNLAKCHQLAKKYSLGFINYADTFKYR